MESNKNQNNTKQFQNFKKNLYNKLQEFQKCRQWADINKWLHLLQEYLQKKKFYTLPHSVTLAKRLAQCLAPALPNGVHSAALKVYVLILTNFQDSDNLLPLLSIGLFPFFEYSSSPLKLQLLKIYETYFLSDSGSIQMIISLINALLTGLNQNNEELIKKIYVLCDKMNKQYGYIWIDGAVWVNILKSNKVKIAGFKYFMKSFKDRDKQKNNQQQSIQVNQQMSEDKLMYIKDKKKSFRIKQISKEDVLSKQNYLKQEELKFLQKLYDQKMFNDSPQNRFPNFSILVVNALRYCLEPDIDSLAKRAALQHLITYLKLSQKQIVSQSDALVLVTSMLRVLTLKQYPLTRRIYQYLFDQPNSEGIYLIDPEQKKYQLKVLIQSIRKMLQYHEFSLKNQIQAQTLNQNNIKNVQLTLSIIEILITDHSSLSNLILPELSYQILKFLKVNCFQLTGIKRQLKKKVFQFNQNVITPNKMIFLRAILTKVQRQQGKEINQQDNILIYNSAIQIQLIQVINILDFYIYTLYKAKFQNSNKNINSIQKSQGSNSNQQNQNLNYQKIDTQQELKQICLTTIQKILNFLKFIQLKYQKLSVQALDFANKIFNETLSNIKNFQFNEKIILKIDQLIQLCPPQNIHARLLTLHPFPGKQMLLPYINQGAFSLICIQNLLSLNGKIQLTKQQQKKLFYAIFKLLQCHLWQKQTFQFIKNFIEFYQQTFKEQINNVDTSQWLIYWRLFEGNVKGGVIRMIQSVKSQNPLKKNMSCKWIQANQHIISKIIDPIYQKLQNCAQLSTLEESQQLQTQILSIFNLLKIIFQTSKQSFARFFFIQKNKYLIPLLELINLNLQLGTQKLKSKAMDMLKFILQQTQTYEQKYQYINLTLQKLLHIFRRLIYKKIVKENDLQNSNNIFEFKQLYLNRISSIQKDQNLSYLQQIQIIQYFASLNLSIRKSLKDKLFKSQTIIQIFEKNKLYDQVIKGLIQSDLPYIRTLYLDFLKDSCDLLAKIPNSKDLLNILVNMILQKLFLILKTQDITSIQQTIQEKKDSNVKNSMSNSNLKNSLTKSRKLSIQYKDQQSLKPSLKDPSASFYEQPNITKNDINIEARYAQIIEMWNSVKFYTKFSIQKQISNLPIVNLLSLILQSFPFSYLKYTQMQINLQIEGTIDNYQLLQDQIKNVTGLKKQVLQIIQIIWAKFSDQICQFLIERGDPRIPIHCTIDPIKVLSTINKNKKVVQVHQYYKLSRLNLPKNFLHYNDQLLMKQNQICYFLYLYLMYCNFSLIKNKKLGGFLDQLIILLKILKLSQHIQTKMWLLQLLYLLSERVLMSRQIHIQNGQKIRQQLQQITKQILDQTIKCIIRQKNFTHKIQIKTGFLNNLFSKEQRQNKNFDFIKNFPPNIFMMSENFKKRNKKANNLQSSKDKKDSFFDQKNQLNQENKQIQNFLFSQWSKLDQEHFKSFLSICCVKTLTAIGNALIINIFEKDITKIAPKIKQIVLSLLPVCQNKNIQNQLNIELISQYIFHVLSNKSLKSEILPLIRKNLLQIYMGNDFFKCTRKSLDYWKLIVDSCTQGADLLSQLLARQGLIQGLLKRKAQLNRQRIKSFQRICFVIYSGKIDKYQNKLRTVVQFLNQVMQQQDSKPAELILMFFCVRILFMRLSHSSLNKMFKTIWPGLIAILIKIFSSKGKNSKNINLVLAALKVVQLIHALNIQQFNFHKWIFITDCNDFIILVFGIKIQPLPVEEKYQNPKKEENQLKNQHNSILTPFIFKPFMTNLLPEHTFKCQFIPLYDSMRYQDNPLLNYRRSLPFKQKRKIIIKQASIQTIEQVQNLAFLLMQYMIDCNQKKVQVSKKEIQQLIEADFIQLDDYIFEMK